MTILDNPTGSAHVLLDGRWWEDAPGPVKELVQRVEWDGQSSYDLLEDLHALVILSKSLDVLKSLPLAYTLRMAVSLAPVISRLGQLSGGANEIVRQLSPELGDDDDRAQKIVDEGRFAMTRISKWMEDLIGKLERSG